MQIAGMSHPLAGEGALSAGEAEAFLASFDAEGMLPGPPPPQGERKRKGLLRTISRGKGVRPDPTPQGGRQPFRSKPQPPSTTPGWAAAVWRLAKPPQQTPTPYSSTSGMLRCRASGTPPIGIAPSRRHHEKAGKGGGGQERGKGAHFQQVCRARPPGSNRKVIASTAPLSLDPDRKGSLQHANTPEGSAKPSL